MRFHPRGGEWLVIERHLRHVTTERRNQTVTRVSVTADRHRVRTAIQQRPRRRHLLHQHPVNEHLPTRPRPRTQPVMPLTIGHIRAALRLRHHPTRIPGDRHPILRRQEPIPEIPPPEHDPRLLLISPEPVLHRKLWCRQRPRIPAHIHPITRPARKTKRRRPRTERPRTAQHQRRRHKPHIRADPIRSHGP